jgi:predicted outer membrane repeat protein
MIDIQDVNTVGISESFFSMRQQVKLAGDSNVPPTVLLRDIKHVNVSGSVFKNLASSTENDGGAMTISESSTSKAASNSFVIERCSFENCQGINGGAISLLDTGGVEITKGTRFIENSAQKAGGAIYFWC